MSMSNENLNPLAWPVAAVGGVLLALCLGIGVRLETGAPPGLLPKAFAHLLGKPAPVFELAGLNGERVSLQSANGAEAWLLYFTQAGCGACKAAYPELARAAQRLPVVAIGTGDRSELMANLGKVAVAVGYDESEKVLALYRVRGVPSALLIDGEGVVRHAATGSKSVREVLTAWRPTTNPIPEGTPNIPSGCAHQHRAVSLALQHRRPIGRPSLPVQRCHYAQLQG